ncbi:MAG: hypothetical protein QHH09_02405 [Microgenomates group bacterium]|nr:hypothetical protein [Microgenomates group bacterium]
MFQTLPLVFIPVHINFDDRDKNLHHTRFFLAGLRYLLRSNSRFFKYLIDINHSDSESANHISQVLGPYPNVQIHIVDTIGRSHALNRGLEYALFNRYPGCIFVNDDVFVTKGGLDKIAYYLQEHPLVGAKVFPRGLIRPSFPPPDYFEANYAYYQYYRNKIKPPFKGNCFGIDIARIDPSFRFPEIRADGSYLLAYYKARHKKDPFICPDVAVMTTIPLNPAEFERSVRNHLAGRQQLIDYCQQYCPDLLPFLPKMPTCEELMQETQRINDPLIQKCNEIFAAILAQMISEGNFSQVSGSYWRR